MSAKDPQMKLRLPSVIKDEIERISSETGRSMNAEIVRRLEWVLGDGSRYYEIDGPDYPEHWRPQAKEQHLNLHGSKYKAEDFPDDDTSNDDLDGVERALIRMWRAMNDGERNALAVVAERLAMRSSDNRRPPRKGDKQVCDENLKEIHDRQEIVLLGIWRIMSTPQRSRLLALMESLVSSDAA